MYNKQYSINEMQKTNKTARIRALECSDCLLRYYGAVLTLNIKFEIFYENHPPTRHIKYKRIDFIPCNKSIVANKLLSTNLEQF